MTDLNLAVVMTDSTGDYNRFTVKFYFVARCIRRILNIADPIFRNQSDTFSTKFERALLWCLYAAMVSAEPNKAIIPTTPAAPNNETFMLKYYHEKAPHC